jgi:hypothetical protein
MAPIKIATDLEAMPEGGEIQWLLEPLFDPSLAEDCSDRPYRRIRKHYYEIAADLFSLVPLEQADIAMIPSDWSCYQGSFHWVARADRAAIRRARRFAANARSLGKPVVVFFAGDRSHERVPIPGAWVIRQSMYRSRAGARDIIMPSVIYDNPLEKSGLDRPTERSWKAVPSVGFCGAARACRTEDYLRSIPFHLVHIFREGYPGVPTRRGLELRMQALNVLERSRLVTTEFTLRDHGWWNIANKSDRDKFQSEFFSSMQASDYQLSVRGSGNYSVRPWEAMAMGRPPLFVDSDCSWPFEGDVDWSRLMVRVQEDDIDRLPEAVADFHARLDDETFRQLQQACRATWERYLTPQGFATWLQGYMAEKVSV